MLQPAPVRHPITEQLATPTWLRWFRDVQAAIASWQTAPVLDSEALGSGVAGRTLAIGRNTSGAGSAGYLTLTNLSGTAYYLWVDTAGKLRIRTTAPVEGSGDTSGTVVGTQT